MIQDKQRLLKVVACRPGQPRADLRYNGVMTSGVIKTCWTAQIYLEKRVNKHFRTLTLPQQRDQQHYSVIDIHYLTLMEHSLVEFRVCFVLFCFRSAPL